MFKRLFLGRGGGRGSSGTGGVGRMGGDRPGAGPGGECLCPRCGYTAPHAAGQPCYKMKCPQCGTKMTRK